MIQCPICQVLNEDNALFCAECGQRFAPAASPQQQAPPQQQQPPSQNETLPPTDNADSRPKGVKLRSPMLGGGDDDDEQGYDKPQLSKLRGASPAGESQRTTGKKSLRSPLLGGDGGDDDDDYDQEDSRSFKKKGSPSQDQEATGSKKKKLRSPLLGEDDDAEEDFTPGPRGTKRGRARADEDDGETTRGGSKKGKMHSPLLGGGGGGGGGAGYDDDDDDEPSRPPRKGGLRSPMLGSDSGSGGGDHHAGPRHRGGLHSPLLGDSDDYDDDDEPSGPPKRSQGPSGGKQRLRSSLLGGGGDYDDDWDEDDDDDDEDNPDVLRSPLLAARKKKRPKPDVNPHGGPEAPPGVQVHRPDPTLPPQQPLQGAAHGVQNFSEHAPPQPYQPQPGQPPHLMAPGPGPGQPPQLMQPGAPPMPGAPPVPGAPNWPGGAQPQPGQPWPPQGQPNPAMQAPPQGGPGPAPPLPVESGPGAPPWQTRMEGPGPGPGPMPATLELDRLKTAGGAEVPPIVDDNEEFQLDISEPQGVPALKPAPPAPPAPTPEPATGRRLPSRLEPKPDEDSEESEFQGPKDRRQRIERRRTGTDRRFSNLLDEKGSSSSSLDDDDFSIGRPGQQGGGNKGLATIMMALGVIALIYQVYYFATVPVGARWDLGQMGDFLFQQMLSGAAALGLIVLSLSSMKK